MTSLMPDAPETTETTAPETDPAPEAAAETADTSVEELVNDETADLSHLPDKTQEEIKKLRRESAKYRQTAQSWEQATQGYHPDDVATIQQALAAGRENPKEVGKWMFEQAKSLLGEEFDTLAQPESENPGEATDTSPNEDGLFTPEQVRKIVEDAVQEKFSERDKQSEQERMAQQIVDASETVGFGPSHEDHRALISLVQTKTDPSKGLQERFSEAAELLKRINGQDNSTDVQDSQPGAGGQSQPGAGHTPVPTSGGTPAGTRQVRDGKAAARERVEKVLKSRRGFQEPTII